MQGIFLHVLSAFAVTVSLSTMLELGEWSWNKILIITETVKPIRLLFLSSILPFSLNSCLLAALRREKKPHSKKCLKIIILNLEKLCEVSENNVKQDW